MEGQKKGRRKDTCIGEARALLPVSQLVFVFCQQEGAAAALCLPDLEPLERTCIS